MRLVEVEWEDSRNGDHSWFDASDFPEGGTKANVIRTVGFVVHQGRERVTLAMSHAITLDQLCDLFTIPHGCIISITELKHG